MGRVLTILEREIAAYKARVVDTEQLLDRLRNELAWREAEQAAIDAGTYMSAATKDRRRRRALQEGRL